MFPTPTLSNTSCLPISGRPKAGSQTVEGPVFPSTLTDRAPPLCQVLSDTVYNASDNPGR